MYIRSDESCIHNLAAFQLCLAGGETPIRRRQIVATSLQVPAPPSFGAKATIILSLNNAGLLRASAFYYGLLRQQMDCTPRTLGSRAGAVHLKLYLYWI